MRGEGGSEQPDTRVEVEAAVGPPWRGQFEDGLGEHLGGADVHLPKTPDRHRELMAGSPLGAARGGVWGGGGGGPPGRAPPPPRGWVAGVFPPPVGRPAALNQRRDV